MKKILLISIFVLSGLIGHLEAANSYSKPSYRYRELPSFTPYATFISSVNEVAVTSFSVVLSSVPTVLRTWTINNVGSSDSKIEIFNANYSTFSGGAELLWSVSGSTPNYKPAQFDIWCSSGLAVNLTGTILPSITTVYRPR